MKLKGDALRKRLKSVGDGTKSERVLRKREDHHHNLSIGLSLSLSTSFVYIYFLMSLIDYV